MKSEELDNYDSPPVKINDEMNEKRRIRNAKRRVCNEQLVRNEQ